MIWHLFQFMLKNYNGNEKISDVNYVVLKQKKNFARIKPYKPNLLNYNIY